MSIEWYRAYHGMPYDPKLRVIARRTDQPMAVVVAVWACVLDAASQHDPRGKINLDPEEVAVIQDIEFEVAKAIIQEFHNKGMLDDDNHLTAWDKRQHTTSTERSQKFRDKKKQDAAAGNTAQQQKTASGSGKQDATAKSTKKDTEQRRADAEQSRLDSEAESDSDQKEDSKQNKNRGRAEKKEPEKEKQKKSGENILDQMLEIWNTEVQEKLTKGHKAVLTAKRKEQLTCRWIEDFAEDIRAWQYYCEIIAASDFCMGRIEGKDWTIDLTWAISSSEHVVKILEGGFSGKRHPAPPPPCHEPLLQTGWDHVLACFTNKYGKSACQSWLSVTEVVGTEICHDKTFVIINCPTRFIQEWLTKHYQSDLDLWWGEHSYQSRRISGIHLKIKEITK